MTMRQYTVAGSDVRVDDYLHNSHAYHSTAAWVRVLHVESPDEHGYVTLHTTVFKTTLHGREGIAVKRDVS